MARGGSPRREFKNAFDGTALISTRWLAGLLKEY
jgi:hypothetical protein